MTTGQVIAWLFLCAACFVAGLIVNAPRGYEDKRGFYYGDEE